MRAAFAGVLAAGDSELDKVAVVHGSDDLDGLGEPTADYLPPALSPFTTAAHR